MYVQVVVEPTPWEGGLVAVNSFGVGGANGHALLLSNKKPKQPIQDDVPRLVCVSGVTKNAVATMLNEVRHFLLFNFPLYLSADLFLTYLCHALWWLIEFNNNILDDWAKILSSTLVLY